jgi:hypothetical protein
MAYVLLLVSLSGCASTGGMFGPRIISSTERSVSVEILPIHNESDALKVAQAHCAQFKRFASLTQDRGGGKFNYECVQ